jgi:hypothetical protein
MNKATISIYRKPKWVWYDFVGFSGPRHSSYTTTYGWSKTGYAEASGQNRSVGARLMRSGIPIEFGTAFTDLSINSQYLQFNNLTQSGDKVQIKYDPKNIQRFWYRYAGINQILFNINDCFDLREISLRRNNIAFGNWDLSNLSNLQVFEISRNVSLDGVTFHPDAPITLFYVDDTSLSTSAIDSIVLHAYNSGINNGKILNRNIMPSMDLCDECDTLLTRGWQITTYPVCQTERETAWRPISPYCVQEESTEPSPPVIGTLYLDGTTYSSFTVHWDPATDADGTIVSYKLTYHNPQTGEGGNVTLDGNTTSHTVTGLYAGQWVVYITATDNDGLQSGQSNNVSAVIEPESQSDPTLYDYKVGDWRFSDQGSMTTQDRTYDEYNIPNDGFWSITDTGLRIDYEDGVTCSGTNNKTYQSAACDNEFSITQPMVLTYSVSGVVPAGGSGYVAYTMYVGPENKYSTMWGDNTNSNCTTQSFNHTFSQVTLQPGTHRIYILSDSDYHTQNNGTYLDFKWSLTPA